MTSRHSVPWSAWLQPAVCLPLFLVAGGPDRALLQPTEVAVDATGLAEARAAINLFVSANGACNNATGSARDPFARLTDALHRARQWRDSGNSGVVIIHVMPGDYVVSHAPADCTVDPIPIRVDLSDVTIHGATQLTIDPETGTPLAVLPGASTFRALEALALTEGVLLITPDSHGNPPARVRVTGLALDGVAAAGNGFFVDRAQDFELRGNSARRFINGIRTRGASGELKGNLLDNRDTGMVLSGGSTVSPAVLSVIGNHACNGEIGFLLTGTGVYGLSSPGAAPIDTSFDPATDGEAIPNRLAVSLRDNVACATTLAGVRFFGVGQLANAYRLLNSRHYETFATIDSRGNRFSDNLYGVSLDAGFPGRVTGNSYSTHVHAEFTDDVFTGNTMGDAFLGFLRLQVALGRAAAAVWSPLDRSTITIRANGGLSNLNFSHPATDTITGLPLSNTLVVNGAVLSNGSCIGACPNLIP